MVRMAQAFGLGTRTGVDLPSERSGTIADRAYLQERWERLRANYCKGAVNPARSPERRRANQEFCDDGGPLPRRRRRELRHRPGRHPGDAAAARHRLRGHRQRRQAGGAARRAGPAVGRRAAAPGRSPRSSGRTVPVAPATLAFLREALGGVTTEGTARGAFAGLPGPRRRQDRHRGGGGQAGHRLVRLLRAGRGPRAGRRRDGRAGRHRRHDRGADGARGLRRALRRGAAGAAARRAAADGAARRPPRRHGRPARDEGPRAAGPRPVRAAGASDDVAGAAAPPLGVAARARAAARLGAAAARLAAPARRPRPRRAGLAAGLVGDPAAPARRRRRPRRVLPEAPRQRAHRRHAGAVAALVDPRSLRAYAPVVYVVACVGLVVVLSPLGATINGAHSWILLPAGFQVQPSEFAKVALVVGMAVLLAEGRDGEDTPRDADVLLVLALAAVPMGLVMLQPDLGTTLVLVAVVLGVLAVGGRAHPLAGRAAAGRRRRQRRRRPARRAGRLPGGPLRGVRQPRPRPARRRLQHDAGPDRHRLGRRVGQGAVPGHPDRRRLHPRAADRLRLHRGGRGAGPGGRGRAGAAAGRRAVARLPDRGRGARHLRPAGRRRGRQLVRVPELRQHRDDARDHAGDRPAAAVRLLRRLGDVRQPRRRRAAAERAPARRASCDGAAGAP